MLDELLGRAGLKERITELESENDSLRAQLDAEQERRAAAATARQEAEQRVNRLEDRITELEDRVARAESGADELDFRDTTTLRRERLAEVLARLRSVETAPESAFTAMVEENVPPAVRDALGERASLVERAAPCLVFADDEGLVSAALSVPVAPDPFTTWDDGFRIEEPWFLPRGRFVLALVRADVFALGVYEDGERVAYEGFESDVKGDHSKGGFSQGRFERRRDAQIADHVEKCEAALAEHDAERRFLVGERTVLDDVDAGADAVRAVDATGKPESALADAFDEFWTARLRLL